MLCDQGNQPAAFCIPCMPNFSIYIMAFQYVLSCETNALNKIVQIHKMHISYAVVSGSDSEHGMPRPLGVFFENMCILWLVPWLRMFRSPCVWPKHAKECITR
jgi:hypothetical protein